jgi:chromatin remodeling complex protein RSC6
MPARKTTTGGAGKKNNNLGRKCPISAELEDIVGNGPMARSEVTKRMWQYIKSHRLQDPNDRRVIKPDAKLAKVIGSSPINMFQMVKKWSKHIEKC